MFSVHWVRVIVGMVNYTTCRPSCIALTLVLYPQVWDLATDKVGWVGATCRATMVGHMHTVRCLQVSFDL